MELNLKVLDSIEFAVGNNSRPIIRIKWKDDLIIPADLRGQYKNFYIDRSGPGGQNENAEALKVMFIAFDQYLYEKNCCPQPRAEVQPEQGRCAHAEIKITEESIKL